ncbi:uncharacterized protein LOC108682913, partial [Hyalella azteca]|uniref:Uncharacterized protein LOC108682913 n=1 Tax=Hyalella azteca TaxID=294128 RepID=A0A8B7PN83_HYAAZ
MSCSRSLLCCNNTLATARFLPPAAARSRNSVSSEYLNSNVTSACNGVTGGHLTSLTCAFGNHITALNSCQFRNYSQQNKKSFNFLHVCGTANKSNGCPGDGNGLGTVAAAVAAMAVAGYCCSQLSRGDNSGDCILPTVHAKGIKRHVPEELQLSGLKLNHRERRFIKFASVEYRGQLYMTPQDFIESVTDSEPRQRLRRRQLTQEDLEKFYQRTPPLRKGTSKMFREIYDKGIMSYTEYLFLLSILTKPQTGFHIAFNMFDTDGNERVDKQEFLVLMELLNGAVHKSLVTWLHEYENSGAPHQEVLRARHVTQPVACLYEEAMKVTCQIEGEKYAGSIVKLQAAIKYGEEDLPGAKSLVDQSPDDDPDAEVNRACLLYK